MANIKSQIKRIRTNDEARLRNKAAKSALRNAMKKVRVAVEAGNKEEALKLSKEAFVLIDKSVSDGVQHANTGARQKSSIQRLVNSLK